MEGSLAVPLCEINDASVEGMLIVEDDLEE